MISKYKLLFLLTALFPTGTVEQIALTTFPRKFFTANVHMVGQGTVDTVMVLIEKEGIQQRQGGNGKSDPKGNVEPAVHFVHIVVRGMGRFEILLVFHTSANLFNGLGLHFLFGTKRWDQLSHRSALQYDRGQIGPGSGQARQSAKGLKYNAIE
jgi:hypothetical protein